MNAIRLCSRNRPSFGKFGLHFRRSFAGKRLLGRRFLAKVDGFFCFSETASAIGSGEDHADSGDGGSIFYRYGHGEIDEILLLQLFERR